MKPFRWSVEKNALLQQERGLSFEQITVAVESGGLLDIVAHPNAERYPRQRIMVVVIDDPQTTEMSRYGGTIAAPVFAEIGGRVAAANGPAGGACFRVEWNDEESET